MSARSALITVMANAAYKAAKGLVRDFSEVDQLQISRKGTANFVTAADLRAEKTLIQELKKARPNFGVLSEEAGEIPGKDPAMRWVIDPLDGTTNFIHAVPYFAIAIGVENRITPTRSEIVAGIIYDPIHDELFHAEKYKGAYLNNRRLIVSPRKNLEEALISTGAPRQGKKDYVRSLRMLRAITSQSIGIRSCGSAALDLAYVAAGRFDGYWHNALKPWDIAAGMLLVQEAGGMVSEITGRDDVLNTGRILATNKVLHNKIAGLLHPKR